MEDQIKQAAKDWIRGTCSQLLDQSGGEQEKFEEHVTILAREIAREVHKLIPSGKAARAFDIFRHVKKKPNKERNRQLEETGGDSVSH